MDVIGLATTGKMAQSPVRGQVFDKLLQQVPAFTGSSPEEFRSWSFTLEAILGEISAQAYRDTDLIRQFEATGTAISVPDASSEPENFSGARRCI